MKTYLTDILNSLLMFLMLIVENLVNIICALLNLLLVIFILPMCLILPSRMLDIALKLANKHNN